MLLRSTCCRSSSWRMWRPSSSSSSSFTPTTSWMSSSALLAMRAASTTSSAAVNHYKRLEVDADASAEEVKAAYRHKALQWHPDVVEEHLKTQAEVRFRAMAESYEVLIDPIKRRAHDAELGIKTTRQHKATKTQTPPQPRHSMRATAGRTAGSSRSQRAASAPRSSSSSSTTKKWKKAFVRGDADRAFESAFDGRSLDEILFQAQRRRRADARAEASSAHSQNQQQKQQQQPAGHAATMQRMMDGAAEAFAEKARKQYGYSILKHIRAHTGLRTSPPATPPPADVLPFRPFVGMKMPQGVRAPPEPQLGPISHVQEHEEAELKGAPPRRPVRSILDAWKKGQRNVEQGPHNMGQLYSFHRPM